MADDVPVSREDGPGTRGTARGTDAVNGATAKQIDPAAPGAAFPRTHHILLLEFGDRKDFDDPRKERRRLFSELLGTFARVLAAAGGGLLHAKGQISLAAAVVAPGLMVGRRNADAALVAAAPVSARGRVSRLTPPFRQDAAATLTQWATGS